MGSAWVLVGNDSGFERAAQGREDCSCPHLAMPCVATSPKSSALCHEHNLRGNYPILQRWIPALKPYRFLSTSRENKATKLSAQQPFSL